MPFTFHKCAYAAFSNHLSRHYTFQFGMQRYRLGSDTEGSLQDDRPHGRRAVGRLVEAGAGGLKAPGTKVRSISNQHKSKFNIFNHF